MEKDAAVDVALLAIHEANDSPEGIKALFVALKQYHYLLLIILHQQKTLILLSSTPDDIYENIEC